MIYRELRQEEFKSIPLEALAGYALPTKNVRVMAAVDKDGAIRAIWCVVSCIHAEPLWVDERHRKSATLLRRLWNGVQSILRSEGLTCAASVILDDRADTRRIAEWVGAKPIPGKLYFLTVENSGPSVVESTGKEA